ncbi:Endopeptidase incomplete domain containing protein [Pandoravirus dulcis]|uniref:Endopeptidase incomplete domain containing protein n=1 Tax=Pandoravirus dulcis TaxID=1349409 RepID=S4VRF0_9VIRU|nr:Endopeptidase incomplete domain containing protein [Pandoravirus dulcis]AGO82938.1 Endopeptidase incomplete domain containing protein [Pandoravirus dulcis]
MARQRCTVSRRAKQRVLAVAAVLVAILAAVATVAAILTLHREFVRGAPHVPVVPVYAYPFRTGDLVLTSGHVGRGRWMPPLHASTAIKMVARSHFNHVAIAFVDPATRRPLFWEMNGAGPALSSLGAIMDPRRGHDVFVRALSRPVDDDAFARIVSAQSGDRYNFGFALDVVRGRWMRRPAREPIRRAATACARTCPHAIAEVYAWLRVLDYGGGRGVDPAALVPADFAADPIDPDVLPLAEGFALGPIVRLL